MYVYHQSAHTISHTYLHVFQWFLHSYWTSLNRFAQPVCCHNMTIRRVDYFSTTITTHHDGNMLLPPQKFARTCYRAQESVSMMLGCPRISLRLCQDPWKTKDSEGKTDGRTHTARFYSSSRTVGENPNAPLIKQSLLLSWLLQIAVSAGPISTAHTRKLLMPPHWRHTKLTTWATHICV
jgi:hypothetical protein